MDNSNDLFEMIRDALATYGFDAQLVEAGEGGIHSVKSLRPEAVFVGAEQSDKSRLALCTKAKKVAGSQIPVILVSSSIPQTDLDLHGKQRYHADAYLSKWDLSSGEFLEKISSLIKLKPDEQDDAQPTCDALPADTAHQGSVNLQDGASEDFLQMPSSGQTPEDFPDDLDKDPGWLSKLYTKIASDNTGDDGKNTPPIRNDTQHALPEDSDTEDDPEQRLIEQEKEIASLQAQLDEARREARSSPFSSDYLNLREDAVQKERDLVRLAHRLERYRRRALAGEERLKDMANRLVNTKAELEQSQARQKEIALRNETIQNELTRLYGTFDESRKHHDTRIEEIKSAHATAVEKMEQAHQAAFDSLQRQMNQKMTGARAEAEAAFKDEIEQQKREHDERISQRKKEHLDKIAKVMRSNEKERQELEARIEALRGEHQDEITEIKASKQEERQELEASIEALRAGHQDEITKIKSSKQEELQDLEVKFEDLRTKHQAALKRVGEEHQAVVADLKKQIAKQKSATVKTDRDVIVNKLTKEHAGEIARLNEKLKETQKEFKSHLNEIKAEQLREFNKKEKKYTVQIKALKKRLEEQRSKEKEEDKSNSQQDEPINKTKIEYTQEVVELKKQLEAEVLKQRLEELKNKEK